MTAKEDKPLAADNALLIANIAALGRSLLMNGSDLVRIGSETVERRALLMLMAFGTDHIAKVLGAERAAEEFTRHDVRIVGDRIHISLTAPREKSSPRQAFRT